MTATYGPTAARDAADDLEEVQELRSQARLRGKSGSGSMRSAAGAAAAVLDPSAVSLPPILTACVSRVYGQVAAQTGSLAEQRALLARYYRVLSLMETRFPISRWVRTRDVRLESIRRRQ